MHRKVFYLSLLTLAFLLIVASQSMFSSEYVLAHELYQEVDGFIGKNIYFAEANGEPSRFDRSPDGLSHFAGLLYRQGATIHTLEWRRGIPEDADLVVLPGPTADLTTDQIARLWNYLNDGGRLLLLLEPNLGRDRVLLSGRGFLELTWTDIGVNARDDYVVTEIGTQVIDRMIEPEESQGDSDTEVTPTPQFERIEVPLLTGDVFTDVVASESPITQGLNEGLAFFSTRTLQIDGSVQEGQAIPLVFTEDDFYGEVSMSEYFENGFSEYNIDRDTSRGTLVLSLAYENAQRGTRMVWIGDREFATNGNGLLTSPSYTASFVFPGNAHFLLNATAWLLDIEAPSEITFPTPGPTATPTAIPSPTPESGN